MMKRKIKTKKRNVGRLSFSHTLTTSLLDLDPTPLLRRVAARHPVRRRPQPRGKGAGNGLPPKPFESSIRDAHQAASVPGDGALDVDQVAGRVDLWVCGWVEGKRVRFFFVVVFDRSTTLLPSSLSQPPLTLYTNRLCAVRVAPPMRPAIFLPFHTLPGSWHAPIPPADRCALDVP